jgi:hypothetical protein
MSNNYITIGYLQFFNFLKAEDNKRYRVLSISNRKNKFYTNDYGRNIIYMDVVVIGGEKKIEIGHAYLDKVQSVVLDIPLTARKWYPFIIGIDVVNKKLQYQVNEETKSNPAGSIDLSIFPEQLTERSILSTLGTLDKLDSRYIIPSARLVSTFVVPNRPFSDSFFNTFLNNASLKPKPDPTNCDKNCVVDACILDKDNKSICNECKSGFDLTANTCVPAKTDNNYSYAILSDGLVPVGANIKLTSKDLLQSKNGSTFSFYFRRSYNSGETAKLISSANGSFDVTIRPGALTDTIQVRINNQEAVSADIQNSFNWVGVTLNFGSTLTFRLDTNGNKGVPSTVTLPARDTLLSEIKVDTHNYEFQIYGITLANNLLDGIILRPPKIDCSVDCSYCKDNICLSCNYGQDTNDSTKCRTRDVRYFAEKGEARARLQDIALLPSLRSRSYTLVIVVDLPATASELFSITNGDSTSRKDITVTYNPEQRNFGVYYSNRFVRSRYPNKLMGDVTNSLDIVNPQSLVVISVKDNTLYYYIYNTYKKKAIGTISMEGEIDFVTAASELITNVKTRDARFYYERATTTESLPQITAERLNYLYQPEHCSSGTELSCNVCKSNQILSNLCLPSDYNKDISGFLSVIRGTTVVSRLSNFNKTDGNSTRKVDTKIGIDIEMTKLNIVFNFRLISLIKSRQGIFKVTLNPLKSPSDSISFVYNPVQNSLSAYFFEGSSQKASITIHEFYRTEEILFWTNIHLTANPKEATLRVKHNSNRSLVQTTAVNLNVQIEKNYYIDSGFSDVNTSSGENFNFEISNVAVSSNLFEFFNAPIIFGRVLSDPCYKAAAGNSYCDSASRVVSTIRAQEIKNDQGQVDQFYKFTDKFIYDQPLRRYVVSFTVNVKALLASTYTANRNTLFAITNDMRPEHESLTINDQIPAEKLTSAIIAIQYDTNRLSFNLGGIPWKSSANTLDIDLGQSKFSDFNSMHIAIEVDPTEGLYVVQVVADNIARFHNATNGIISPISASSVMFKHPSIQSVNFNFHNPRLDYNIEENALSVLSNIPKYDPCSSDKNCKSCFSPFSATCGYCVRCKDGFTLIEGLCRPITFTFTQAP